jgi:hypothetical protein
MLIWFSVGKTLKPPALIAKSVRVAHALFIFDVLEDMLASGAAASCRLDSATDGE